METKTNNEELIQETEIVEEEATKFDKQKAKKIVKKVLIGTGIAAIIGGVVAAMKHSKDYEASLDELDIPSTEDSSKELKKMESESEKSENN